MTLDGLQEILARKGMNGITIKFGKSAIGGFFVNGIIGGEPIEQVRAPTLSEALQLALAPEPPAQQDELLV